MLSKNELSELLVNDDITDDDVPYINEAIKRKHLYNRTIKDKLRLYPSIEDYYEQHRGRVTNKKQKQINKIQRIDDVYSEDVKSFFGDDKLLDKFNSKFLILHDKDVVLLKDTDFFSIITALRIELRDIVFQLHEKVLLTTREVEFKNGNTLMSVVKDSKQKIVVNTLVELKEAEDDYQLNYTVLHDSGKKKTETIIVNKNEKLVNLVEETIQSIKNDIMFISDKVYIETTEIVG